MAKLYLIAGHGAKDPGTTNGSRTEASDVRRLCAKIKELGGSQVEVLDTSKNWYETGGISSLRLPSGAMLCEVHRDSGPSSARGAHVIIKDGFKADSFDTALAAKLSAILPGRADTVVKRGNLANVNRAAKAGINYRLAEVGFISNSTDNSIFDSKLAEIARAFLSAAGIAASATTTPGGTQVAGVRDYTSNKAPSVYNGSAVRSGNGTTSLVLFTADEFKKIVGRALNPSIGDCVATCNGDPAANGAVPTGVQLKGGQVIQTFASKCSGLVRINFTITAK